MAPLMLFTLAVPPFTTIGTDCPFTQTPTTSLKLELMYSGYSSDAKTNCIVIMLPVGVKVTSSHDASKVCAPAKVLNSALPSGPLVLVEVPALRFGSPPDCVKSRTFPVDRITPVSEGTTPGANCPLE